MPPENVVDQAELEADVKGSTGVAPGRSEGFQKMAEIMEAAFKGKDLPLAASASPAGSSPSSHPVAPVAPAATPAPVKPEPKPVKAAETEAVKPSAKADDDEKEDPFENPNYTPVHGDWKKMREKLKAVRVDAAAKAQLETETKALREELQKLKSQPTPKVEIPDASKLTELETLNKQIEQERQRRTEIENQLKAVALERSPEFKAHFQTKFDTAIDTAKRSVPAELQEKVVHILKMEPSQARKEMLGTIITDLDEVDRAQLASAVVEMDRARHEREEALKDQDKNYQRYVEIESEKKTREQKLVEAQREAGIKAVLEAARQFPSFQPSADSEEQMARAKSAEEFVTKFFRNQLSPDEVAMLPVIKVEYERLAKEHAAMEEELRTTKQAIAQYEQSAGKLGSGSAKSTTSKEKKGFIQAYLEKVKS